MSAFPAGGLSFIDEQARTIAKARARTGKSPGSGDFTPTSEARLATHKEN
jgi:hypothetical protein